MKNEKITLLYLIWIGIAAYGFACFVEAVFCLLFSPKYPYFYLFSAAAYLFFAFFSILGGVVLKSIIRALFRGKSPAKAGSALFYGNAAALFFVALTPTLLYGYFQIIMAYRWSLKSIPAQITFVSMFGFFFFLCALIIKSFRPYQAKMLKRTSIYFLMAGPLMANLTMFFLTGEILSDAGRLKFVLSIIFYSGFFALLIWLLSLIHLAQSRSKANLVFASFLIFFVVCLAVSINIRDRLVYSFKVESKSGQKILGPGSPNIFLLIMDTARYDRMGCYGYPKPTTPHIDAFAGKSVLFKNAIAPSPWTLPSHASMFTGLPSFIHNAVHSSPDNFRSANILSSGFTTLAEILNQQGYATGGSVANTAYCPPWTGLNQGFEFYWCAQDRGSSTLLSILAMKLSIPSYKKFLWYTGINNLNSSRRVNDMALKWARANQRKNKKFFLFVNYMEAHGLYYLPGRYSHKFVSPPRNIELKERDEPCGVTGDAAAAEVFSKWYDNQIASLDNEIGRLLQELEKNNFMSDSLIIIVSDHGELLGEHQYYGHQYFLYDELLRVPLMIKYPPPGRAEIDTEKRILNLDLFAEILDVARIPIPEAVIARPFSYTGNTIFSEVRASQRSVECPERFGKDLVCIYTSNVPGYKMIFNPVEPVELYDLEKDPLEQKNLLGIETGAQKTLADLRLQHVQGLELLNEVYAVAREKSKLNKTTLERLRALGYLK